MKKYKFSITLKKFGYALAEVIVAGLCVYLTDNQMFLGLVPIFEALRNWLKHR